MKTAITLVHHRIRKKESNMKKAMTKSYIKFMKENKT